MQPGNKFISWLKRGCPFVQRNYFWFLCTCRSSEVRKRRCYSYDGKLDQLSLFMTRAKLFRQPGRF